MKWLHRASVLLELARQLRAAGSWCGETHMQKATYFLQEVTRVPLEFEFVLYKHGPYSFDLADDLGGMLGERFLMYEPVTGYGPRLKEGTSAEQLRREFPEPAAEYAPRIASVAGWLQNKRVTDLERLGTALYVTLEGRAQGPDRAARIVQLKSHVTPQEAEAAIRDVDAFREAAAGLELQVAR